MAPFLTFFAFFSPLSCPPVAVFLARERLAGRPRAGNAGSLELDVVALSDSMGWEVPLVKRALRQLQWDPRLRPGGGSGTPQNPPSVSGSGVVVEFGELAFHFRAYGDLSEEELDSLCQFLHQRVVAREKTALKQLRACFRAFKRWEKGWKRPKNAQKMPPGLVFWGRSGIVGVDGFFLGS